MHEPEEKPAEPPPVEPTPAGWDEEERDPPRWDEPPAEPWE